MLSLDVRRLSVQRAFWSGAARIFDLFGLLYDHEPVLDHKAAAKADQEAMAKDWEVVFGDLAVAWKITEPRLRYECERP